MARRLRKDKPKRDPRVERSLFSWWSYLVVLFVVAAAITVTFAFLFQNVELPHDVLAQRTPLVLANVLFISGLVTLAWGLYRRHTTQKPVNKILAFTEALRAGDLSARIRPRKGPLRNEFDVMIEDLNSMAEELGSVEALRTDFVASVSHEMKTPLTVISNYTTILQDPTLSDEEREEYARKTGEAARRLSDMVANTLKLNKLDNQAIVPEAAPFDLSEQLAECLLAFEDVFENRRLALEVDLEEGVRAVADPELTMLMWNNLVGNAVKFTDSGGTVRVALSAAGGAARVTVADTGCGIEPDALPRVFDKFYQADASRASAGNGLGLALVKRVAGLSGGDVSVESELGSGTTFTVTLPLAK